MWIVEYISWESGIPVFCDKETAMLYFSHLHQVDANCDGSVDWDEYLSYMLLEFQEKSQMSSVVEGGLFSPDR